MTTKIAILDLECTCDQGDNPAVPREQMEIIEIGCVLADLEGNTYEELSIFVKPTAFPKLTDFCKSLTTIKQEDVDNGMSLSQALNALDEFLFAHNVSTWGSWGDFDKNQILREMRRKRINQKNYPFLEDCQHVNISTAYFTHQGMPRKCGVGKALSRQKMTFIGTPHRGIDDVRNIARLLPFTNVSL